MAGIPVACAVAVLKYRLYEIDKMISRTLAYAIVTGLLVGVYVGLVLLATQVLTIKSPVAVAVATLAAAALVTPLRFRVQHLVDRRFDRTRYDADQTLTAFADWLKDAVDQDEVRADLLGVVHRSWSPPTPQPGSGRSAKAVGAGVTVQARRLGQMSGPCPVVSSSNQVSSSGPIVSSGGCG